MSKVLRKHLNVRQLRFLVYRGDLEKLRGVDLDGDVITVNDEYYAVNIMNQQMEHIEQ